jgi:hypothetical protein
MGEDMTTRYFTSLGVRWCWLLLMTAFAFGLGGERGQAMTVLTPSATTVAPGGSFSIELEDAAFDTSAIFGIDVDIGFDASLFKLDSVTPGSWLTDPITSNSDASVIFSPTGSVSICCWTTLGLGPSVFTAVFDVLGTANPGPGTISTTISFSTDPNAIGSDFEYMVHPDPSTVAMQVSPLSVPEPATWSLLLIGAFATMLAARWRGAAPCAAALRSPSGA